MHINAPFDAVTAQITSLQNTRAIGRVIRVDGGVVHVDGLADHACVGDPVRLHHSGGTYLSGEIVRLADTHVVVLPDAAPDGLALQDRVALLQGGGIAPTDAWIGRVIDPMGIPMDGKPLLRGAMSRPVQTSPPPPAMRRPLGPRLRTGLAVTDTMLPLVTGQRMGLFAGSGVGKSSLLGHLGRHMQADVVVVAMIGERGRELRHFLDDVLGPDGAARAVVVAATSDQSALMRRRCAWTAMTVAEHFRDQGKNVLLLADSITRFAEAHREVAVAAGEAPVLRGYPPSTAHQIMSLCERAGPGHGTQGDISAIFSVLVAGSDMDEPIADILRGVLDGHIILDREIAERGRYPAVDVLRSVSRSLPAAATEVQNETLATARRLLGAYERNAMMIRAGLYAQGADPEVDQAISIWPELDAFFARSETGGIDDSFNQLELVLRRANIRNQANGGIARQPNAA